MNAPCPDSGPIAPSPGLRLSHPGGHEESASGAIFDSWLASLAPLLGERERADTLQELRDHLDDRLRDLMLLGIAESQAASSAVLELGDAPAIAKRYREASQKPRRRLLMNLSVVGIACASLIAGVIALKPNPDPVATRAYTPSHDNGPRDFLLSRVTIPDNATLDQALSALGAPSGLPVSPLWPSIQQLGVTPDTPVAGTYKDAAAGKMLSDLSEGLEPLSHDKLEWRVLDSKLVIAPRSYFDRIESVLASYDVSGVVRARQAADASKQTSEIVEEISVLVRSLAEPDSWRANGGDLGEIVVFGDRLFIRAPQRVQELVKWILSELPTLPSSFAQSVPSRTATAPEQTASLPMRFSSPEPMAQLLSALCDLNPAFAPCRAVISSQATLVLTGSPDQVRASQQIVDMLDQPAPHELSREPGQTLEIHLQFLAGEPARKLLGLALNASPNVKQCAVTRILEVRDPQTLAITTTPDQMPLIRRFVQSVDIPSPVARQ